MCFRDAYTHAFNRNRSPPDFKVGQKVLLHAPLMATRGCTRVNRKFLSPWIGPAEIKRIFSNTNVLLSLKGKAHQRVHMDRIKHYSELDEGQVEEIPPSRLLWKNQLRNKLLMEKRHRSKTTGTHYQKKRSKTRTKAMRQEKVERAHPQQRTGRSQHQGRRRQPNLTSGTYT